MPAGAESGRLQVPADAEPDRLRARARLWVAGRVQGVGFRFFVRDVALRLGLAGFARNLRDRRVEIAVEGPRSQVEALIAAVRTGPRGAAVRTVDVTWEPPRGELGFGIRGDDGD